MIRTATEAFKPGWEEEEERSDWLTTESDNLTLDKYLTTLSNADKELLKGFPLTVGELVDSDDEVLDTLMTRQGLSKEEQIRRSEIIS